MTASTVEAPVRALPLRDYQRECIEALHAAWARGVRRPAVVLPTGTGKGHTLDTEVPTPGGLCLWGELAVGDEVYGSDGRPTRVTAVFDRGELDTWHVVFSDGSHVMADGDHLWAVRDGKYRRTSRESRTMTTAELAAQDLKPGKGFRFRVPMTAPVERPECTLPLAPYAVGALIANGGMLHSGTMLTTPDPEVARRVRAAGVTCNEIADTTPGVCVRFSLPGLTQVTRALGLRVHSGEKRIPRTYLEAPVAQRIELLHGLMDGDGSSRAASGRRSVRYSTTSLLLAEDLAELVGSLGGTGSIRQAVRAGKNIEYTVSVLLPVGVSPFSPNGGKGAAPAPGRDLQPKRAIVSIRPAGRHRIRCITVAAPDNLYLVTRDYLVTHNTVIFSHLIREFLATPGERRRVVVLAHRDELVSQARGKVLSVAPGLSVGVVKGSVNETDAAVVCASVQTLRNPKRSAQVRDVGLVIVDEAHHATATSYLDVLDYYGCFSSTGALAVGFTATMERSDGVALGNVWEEIAYEYSILKAIRRKYLCDPIGHAVKVADMDMSQVRTTAGDFREGDLGEALSDSSALHVAAEKYLELGGGQQGLAFLPTVATAHETVEVFAEHGITAAAVDGTTPTDERRAIVRDYTAGNIPVLSNCMVFTEGTDFPNAAVALLMRPTQSRSLYVQTAGRVLRPDPERPGKVATLLDISGVAARHSLIGRGTLLGADVEPEDGESLAELDDRLAELAAEEEAKRGNGPAPVKPVRLYEAEDYELDLFHGQRLVWHHAPRTGVPFVTLAERLVMVMPDGQGGFDVAWIWRSGAKGAKLPGAGRGGWIARHVADHGYALAWAEGAHEDHGWDPGYSDRTRAWRKRKVVPESKQAVYASALGIPWLPDWRAGQLADAIDTKLTGKAVDAFAGPYLTKIGALVS